MHYALTYGHILFLVAAAAVVGAVIYRLHLMRYQYRPEYERLTGPMRNARYNDIAIDTERYKRRRDHVISAIVLRRTMRDPSFHQRTREQQNAIRVGFDEAREAAAGLRFPYFSLYLTYDERGWVLKPNMSPYRKPISARVNRVVAI